VTPDASKHNPDPAYARRLLRSAGITQADCAKRLGISYRSFKRYLAERVPYLVQYALEGLEKGSK
jgi:predicted DNA-binding protein (UPF0251 family)